MSQAIVFVCLTWTQLTTAPGRFGEPAPIVRSILLAEMEPAARMAALSPFLNVGMNEDEAERVLGPCLIRIAHGPVFSICTYPVARRGVSLTLSSYPDGEIYAVSYKGKDGESVTLLSDDPVTWPKTTTGHNADLRKWKKDIKQ